MLSIVLDLAGVACLCALAWLIWPPLVLLVVGLALLGAGWARS